MSRLKNLRVAIYARTRTSPDALESQVEALHRYVESQGQDRLNTAVFQELGCAADLNRTAVQRIMTNAASFDVLVVESLDRLAHSAEHQGAVLKWLARVGLRLISINDAIDTLRSQSFPELEVAL